MHPSDEEESKLLPAVPEETSTTSLCSLQNAQTTEAEAVQDVALWGYLVTTAFFSLVYELAV